MSNGFMSFFSGNRTEGQPPTKEQQPPTNTPAENNAGVPDEGEDINIWGQPEKSEPTGEPDKEPTDIDKALDEYVGNLDFGLKLDREQVANDFNEGKVDSLQNALTDAAKAAYKRAVLDISGSFKQFETRIMDRVKSEVSTGISTSHVDQAVRTEFKDIIKDKDIGPVMRAAAQNLQQQGHSEEAIIAQLHKFAGKFGSKFGNRQSNNPHRPGPPQRGDNDEPDWLKFLTEE